MTAPTTQPALPGLEVPGVAAHDTPMVVAAKQTLAELQRTGAVQSRHAVQVQLVIQLAHAIDRGASSGRASAVAMASKELRETMLVLDPPDELASASARDRLREFMAALEDHANSGAR
jgi:hypothetical protein